MLPFFAKVIIALIILTLITLLIIYIINSNTANITTPPEITQTEITQTEISSPEISPPIQPTPPEISQTEISSLDAHLENERKMAIIKTELKATEAAYLELQKAQYATNIANDAKEIAELTKTKADIINNSNNETAKINATKELEQANLIAKLAQDKAEKSILDASIKTEPVKSPTFVAKTPVPKVIAKTPVPKVIAKPSIVAKTPVPKVIAKPSIVAKTPVPKVIPATTINPVNTVNKQSGYDPTNLKFRWLKNKNNLYLSSYHNKSDNGTKVIQWDKVNEDGHQWRFNQNGTIENKMGKCLVLDPNVNVDGVQIALGECNNLKPGNLWSLNEKGYLVNQNYKCIGINNNSLTWGENAIQLGCTDDNSMIWTNDFDP